MAESKGERIAFVGLGGMGGAMAKNLAKWLKDEGYPPLTVWNRTASKCEPFKALGCSVAPSLESVALKCEVVIASLANDTAAREVYTALFEANDREGTPTTFIETSTLYPDFVGELEAKAKEKKGCLFSACPVFGPVPMAINATLCVCISGSDQARTLAKRFMVPSVASRSIDVGIDVKRAAGLKLIGNSLILGIIEMLGEALTLAQKTDVGTDLVSQFVKEFLPAPSMVGYCDKILNNKFDSTMGFPLSGGMKDASHIKAFGAANNCPMPITDVAYQHLITAKAIGAGQQSPELDWCSLVSAQRLSAGLEPFGKGEAFGKVNRIEQVGLPKSK